MYQEIFYSASSKPTKVLMGMWWWCMNALYIYAISLNLERRCFRICNILLGIAIISIKNNTVRDEKSKTNEISCLFNRLMHAYMCACIKRYFIAHFRNFTRVVMGRLCCCMTAMFKILRMTFDIMQITAKLFLLWVINCKVANIFLLISGFWGELKAPKFWRSMPYPFKPFLSAWSSRQITVQVDLWTFKRRNNSRQKTRRLSSLQLLMNTKALQVTLYTASHVCWLNEHTNYYWPWKLMRVSMYVYLWKCRGIG